VESALWECSLFEEHGFTDIKISVKHHDPVVMINAYRQLAQACDYPLHLGVTEAGPAFQGTVKSAVAFGALLAEGIGDTIRVSLSAPPVEEVKVGIAILESLGLRDRGLEIVSCPSCGRAQVDVYTLADQVTAGLEGLEVPLRVAVMGCVVNGPGEAREADLGVASGNGKGQIFVKGEVIKTVPESQIVETLIEEAMKLAEAAEPAGAQAEGFKDGGADLDFLDRRGGEGDPDRVADALGEQGAEGDGRLDRALEGRAGLGDAEVQRVLAALGEQAVGVDHHDRVVVLDRDLDVAEAVLLEQGAFPERGLDQGLGSGLAVLGQQALVQRAGVDADADRYAGVAGRLGDVGDLVVERLDVAGVDADRAAAGVDRGEHILRLEVDVGDDRDLRLARDGGQRFGVVLGGHGDPDDLAARRGELGDLLEGGVDVRGQRGGHRLNGHGGVAADGDGVLPLADDELTGLAAGREWFRRQLGQAKINTHTEDRLTVRT